MDSPVAEEVYRKKADLLLSMKPVKEDKLSHHYVRKTKLLFYDTSYEEWHIGIIQVIGDVWCRLYAEKCGIPYYYVAKSLIFENTPENKLQLLLGGERFVNG